MRCDDAYCKLHLRPGSCDVGGVVQFLQRSRSSCTHLTCSLKLRSQSIHLVQMFRDPFYFVVVL